MNFIIKMACYYIVLHHLAGKANRTKISSFHLSPFLNIGLIVATLQGGELASKTDFHDSLAETG